MSRVNVGGRKRDARMVKTASELAQPGSPFCPFEPEVQMLRVGDAKVDFKQRSRLTEAERARAVALCPALRFVMPSWADEEKCVLGLQGDSTPSKEILILEVITEATAKVVCFHTAASLSAASLSTLFDGLPLATAVAILAEAPPEQWETTFQFINSVSLGAETQVTEQARAKLLASTSGGDVSLSANELACVAYQSAALRRKAELDAVHELSQAAILLLRPCAHCGHLSHVHMYCALCKEVRFCDKQCQKAHWRAGHRETCAGRAAVASAAAAAAAAPAQAE